MSKQQIRITKSYFKSLRNQCLIFIFLLGTNSMLNAQSFEWANQHGSTDKDAGHCIVEDDEGNVYVAGYFRNTLDFDPGPGVHNLVSNGLADAFLAKYTAEGDFIWAKSFGSIDSDAVQSIDLDESGNVYVAGTYQEVTDFDPGPGEVIPPFAGSSDISVSKFNSSGDFIWVKTLNGSAIDGVSSLVIGPDESILITGHFWSTELDMDPGPETFDFISFGLIDIYVLKLDLDGNFIWAKQMGGSGTDRGYGIEVDEAGNVYYVATTTSDPGDFDPGEDVFGLSAGGPQDIVVSKLDPMGNFLWAKNFGGIEGVSLGGMALDESNNVHVVGRFEGPVDFDPSPSSYVLDGGVGTDPFVCKFDSMGNFTWAIAFEGIGRGRAICTDIFNNVYAVGTFAGPMDFESGPGTTELVSIDSEDMYICKYDSAANFLWVRAIGGTGSEAANDIMISGSGSIYTTGRFQESIDFDPGDGVEEAMSAGDIDIFLLKLDQCWPTFSELSVSECYSYTSPSGDDVWTDSGVYTDTIPNIEGCDSIITIDLTINSSSYSTDVQMACDSYTWIDGNTYTESNDTSTWVLTNMYGCDSIITLDLIIEDNIAPVPDNPDLSDITEDCEVTELTPPTATDSCAGTIIGTHDVVLPITEVGTTVVTWTYDDGNGNTTTQEQNIIITEINVDVSISGFTLTADNVSATYQWLDCDNDFEIIPGATDQTFTPEENGNFAVEITDNGCVDTSLCYSVEGIGINELQEPKVEIYPNPATANVSVQLSQTGSGTISIYSLEGKLVQTTSFTGVAMIELDLSDLEKGVYHINIETSGTLITKELIRQ